MRYFLTRPVVAVLIAGSCAFLCYELWYLAERWIKGTFLADFPFLWALGTIMVFLSLVEIVLNAGQRLFSRHEDALH